MDHDWADHSACDDFCDDLTTKTMLSAQRVVLGNPGSESCAAWCPAHCPEIPHDILFGGRSAERACAPWGALAYRGWRQEAGRALQESLTLMERTARKVGA